jgi:hypothetical protein
MNENSEEREWSAQERAMRDEQLPHAFRQRDAREQSYRLIARALREPSPDSLPPDFARRVARVAADDAPFEAALMAVLVAALAICAAVLVARFESQWTPDAQTSGWLLAFAGCVGTSWLLEKWQRRRL